jgi:rhodanese-related sulfurtransferase
MARETDIDTVAAAGDDALVVDVREPGEYAAGHVPGALNIPLSQVATRIDEIPSGDVVYVVCASGNRSKAGADLISRTGREAYSVAGGTAAWQRSGRPVTTGSRA